MLVHVKPEIAASAHVGSLEDYRRLYQESIEAPERFWLRQADLLGNLLDDLFLGHDSVSSQIKPVDRLWLLEVLQP